MTSDLPSRRHGHKAVAQHQVGGNRAEQLAVDVELVHVDELEPIALRQAPGLGRFGGVVHGAGGGLLHQRLSGALGFRSTFHQCTTDESWNNGKYNASNNPAMTMPSTMSRTGSTSVTKRSRLVSSSSS